MDQDHKKWDAVLRQKIGVSGISTDIEWQDVENRLSEVEKKGRNKSILLRIAAVVVVVFGAYSLYTWNATPSWEYMPVASVESLDNTSTTFFSASELHGIYISGK